MPDLSAHLGAVDRATLFDTFERATSRVGLALFVVQVRPLPPLVVYASQLLADFVGRPRAELVNRPPWELVAPAQQDRVRDIIASRGPGAPPISLDFEIERPDGSRRVIEVGVARITTDDAELAVCYFRDTTALHRSQTSLHSLIENAPDGVVILQQGHIVLANRVAVRQFGVTDFEAIRGRLLSEFLMVPDAERAAGRIARLYAGAPVQSSEYQLRTGLVVEVHSVRHEHDGQPAILSFVRDITERRRMQQQLFHADRLAALGTMAATVAHEINNPLTYLQLNLQRLEREAAHEPDPARASLLRDHIANALHGVERVARIVRDLRSHARDDADEPSTPVDVAGVVDRVLQMVEHDLKHRAELVRRDPDQPAIIDGSAARLEQILLNLLVNAIQSLDTNHANQITIAIEVAAEITITVGDTGPGLPDPERAFEPFFTTKPLGQGTGLGLSVCKQLVERMNGRIEIVRTGPAGTELAVVLPRRTSAVVQSAPAAVPVSGKRLQLLVIDDEPHVRHALGVLLEAHHDVDVAADGESALALLADTDYDVILCDLMMPQMNGRDFYEQLQARRPGFERRIIFVTGGAFLPALADFLDSVDNLKLAKPFRVEQVLALIRSTGQ